jgi:hypothetical protein
MEHTVFFHASTGVLVARHPKDAWKNTICSMYRNNLLMMNKYLFETCRGQFNWNKLKKKSASCLSFLCICMRCEVLTRVSMNNTIFWDRTTCRFVSANNSDHPAASFFRVVQAEQHKNQFLG